MCGVIQSVEECRRVMYKFASEFSCFLKLNMLYLAAALSTEVFMQQLPTTRDPLISKSVGEPPQLNLAAHSRIRFIDVCENHRAFYDFRVEDVPGTP